MNGYVPHLQFAAGLLGYVQRQLGLPIASTAPLAKITDAFNRPAWVLGQGNRNSDRRARSNSA